MNVRFFTGNFWSILEWSKHLVCKSVFFFKWYMFSKAWGASFQGHELLNYQQGNLTAIGGTRLAKVCYAGVCLRIIFALIVSQLRVSVFLVLFFFVFIFKMVSGFMFYLPFLPEMLGSRAWRPCTAWFPQFYRRIKKSAT